MFKEKTVLILGAGASRHYGYPTGEQLILKVCKLAEKWRKEIKSIMHPHEHSIPVSLNMHNDLFPLLNFPNNYCHDSQLVLPKQKILLEKLETLASKLKSLDPINIDTFLRDHPQLQEIGKILIASVLLDCEEHSIKIPHIDHQRKLEMTTDADKRDNWYRFLIHALASAGSKEELLKIATDRKLIIITFNYDVSLEYHLYKALSEIEAIGEQTAKQFMKELKIIHVYGELRKIDWVANEPLKDYVVVDSNIELAMQCAKGIETIDRDKQQKLADTEDIVTAKSAVANANPIVILGYGFDDANNEIIGLNEIISKRSGRNVLYTNYNDSARIERKIKLEERYKIKSTKNVYLALAEDFDLT